MGGVTYQKSDSSSSIKFFLNDKMIEPEFQVNMAVLNSFPNDKMIKPEFQVNQIRKLTPFIKLRTI